ncbi:MAG: hypothetical protein HYY37_05400 [Candidatus Aenigmarchaeota archaeon]|nr:hypothetical protein [Candidatus Aenigmarchaeota archaeon]
MEAEAKLQQYMAAHTMPGTFVRFAASCHTAEEAARAAGTTIDEIVKNVCLIGGGWLIVAIVMGRDRASTTRIAELLGIERPRPAAAEEILMKTGYPAGGVPSFGYEATFLIDANVMERPLVYTSGGSDRSLVRIAPADLQKANGAAVARIRK